MKNIKMWFSGLSAVRRVAVVATLSLLVLGAVGATAQPNNNITPPTTPDSVQNAPKIEVKQITTTDAIPYTSSTIQDGSLERGTTKTRTRGVDGLLTHTYFVTYTDGVETSRTTPTDNVTIKPINEVVAVGTKAPAPVCENGTYVNSAGNTVCSPYSSPSAPSGASARCRDGTYSFSQSRSGTCSHHGGVAAWL